MLLTKGYIMYKIISRMCVYWIIIMYNQHYGNDDLVLHWNFEIVHLFDYYYDWYPNINTVKELQNFTGIILHYKNPIWTTSNFSGHSDTYK